MINKFPNIDKIIYLDCKTIIRKTLLPLWEINMKNKVVGGVEVISFGDEKANHIILKDNFYIDCNILLLNCKEWKKLKLYDKIDFYVKSNKVFESLQDNLNILTDTRKIRLNPKFIYCNLEIIWTL